LRIVGVGDIFRVCHREIWPASLRSWTNIADKGDVGALKKELALLFDDRVQDVLVYNGSHAHDATRYLTARETGAAIAGGLND
jgi:hypothetical protein